MVVGLCVQKHMSSRGPWDEACWLDYVDGHIGITGAWDGAEHGDGDM